MQMGERLLETRHGITISTGSKFPGALVSSVLIVPTQNTSL